ncbi:serine/threonine protein kinase [Nocardioides flavescens]|uniref:Serine/threonine protein kinase n=1 Tax=Nocardioides flavescens TaxID=2691959 RepID=A0A6L7F094_9ACTN|nr:serine/threonine protein kinase [Nocardioides flavescens]MXG91608.1 serine/threonine protein kinase [Nocardioides flavescens]
MSVILQLPAVGDAGTPRSWELAPGQRVLVGREAGVEVRIDDPHVPRWAAEIRAVSDFWTLTNLGGELPLVVENPEGGGEFVKVAPGRSGAPVPFEFARIRFPTARSTTDLLVFAPEHQHEASVERLRGESTRVPFRLDRSAKYFLVLLALCEPRLIDPASLVVPTDRDVLDRLRGVPGCDGLSPSAIGFHVDYLADHKLRVKEREAVGAESRADHRRQAIVSLALRYDLVRLDDMRRLDATA